MLKKTALFLHDGFPKDDHDAAPHDDGCDDDDGNGALQPCLLRHAHTGQTEHAATYHPLKSALINIAVIYDSNGIYAAWQTYLKKSAELSTAVFNDPLRKEGPLQNLPG